LVEVKSLVRMIMKRGVVTWLSLMAFALRYDFDVVE
jgi:hypothetical protein